MSSISIDLQHDPEVPRGRGMLEELVGAHMVAQTEDELQLLVRHSMDEIMAVQAEYALKVMTHATYRGQALIVRLLSLAARQRMALDEADVAVPEGLRQRDPTGFDQRRLAIWGEVRDDLNFSHS